MGYNALQMLTRLSNVPGIFYGAGNYSVEARVATGGFGAPKARLVIDPGINVDGHEDGASFPAFVAVLQGVNWLGLRSEPHPNDFIVTLDKLRDITVLGLPPASVAAYGQVPGLRFASGPRGIALTATDGRAVQVVAACLSSEFDEYVRVLAITLLDLSRSRSPRPVGPPTQGNILEVAAYHFGKSYQECEEVAVLPGMFVVDEVDIQGYAIIMDEFIGFFPDEDYPVTGDVDLPVIGNLDEVSSCSIAVVDALPLPDLEHIFIVGSKRDYSTILFRFNSGFSMKIAVPYIGLEPKSKRLIQNNLNTFLQLVSEQIPA